MQKPSKNRLPSFKEGINLHQETILIKITYQVHLRISAKIQHFNRKILKLEIGTRMRESWVMFKSRDKIHIRSIKKAIFLKLWKKFTSQLIKMKIYIKRVTWELLKTKSTIKAWMCSKDRVWSINSKTLARWNRKIPAWKMKSECRNKIFKNWMFNYKRKLI
jgi:hypothetical protein